MPVLRQADVAPVSGNSYPAPHDAIGRYSAWPISDAGGITGFGAYVETLEPGALSSQRHWHEAEDEFVYVLQGEVELIEDDGAHRLGPGDAAGWKAGVANAHHLANRSAAPAIYLIVGTRSPSERGHYPDIDLALVRDRAGSRYTRKDGTPYPDKRAHP